MNFKGKQDAKYNGGRKRWREGTTERIKSQESNSWEREEKSRKRENYSGLGAENKIRPAYTQKRRNQTVRQHKGTVFPCSKCFLLSPSAVCYGGGGAVPPSQTHLALDLNPERTEAEHRDYTASHKH